MQRLVFAFLALILFARAGSGAGPGDRACRRAPRPPPMSRCNRLPVMDATPKFDAGRATAAYLARVSGAARARSDAYFEGGYWLLLVDLV